MLRLALLLLSLTAASTQESPRPSSPGANAPLAPSYLRWVGDHHRQMTFQQLAEQFLRASGQDAGEFQRLMTPLRARLRKALDAVDGDSDLARLEVLNRAFFNEAGFSADLDLESFDNLFPDRILERRRGYCLGLCLVILAATEPLGWELELGAAPRHTYLRLGDHFLETTLAEIHDAKWYQARFRVPASALQTLNRRQLAAHLANNHGYVLLQQGHLDAARQDFATALELWPGLVEARINQGVRLARSGDFDKALARFDTAKKEWPGDVLLDLNRVQALFAAGKRKNAVEEVVRLLRPPVSTEAARAARDLRARLSPEKEWDLVQALALAQSRLRDPDDLAPGLAAEYFSDTHLQDRVLSRVDRDIDFQWGWKSPAREVPKDRFSARWDGILRIPVKDKYSFFITCSDGVRIWLDGRLVVDAWRRANDNFPRGEVPLEAGDHELRIEYFESVGEAGLIILVARDGSQKLLDLREHLWHRPE